MLIAFSFIMGFIPTARAKSGDMVSSSDPELKHMSAFMPLILRTAVGQRPIQILGCVPLDWLGFTFKFEAHVFWLLVFSCWAEGPWKVVFIPLPHDLYCSFIEETSLFAIFCSLSLSPVVASCATWAMLIFSSLLSQAAWTLVTMASVPMCSL